MAENCGNGKIVCMLAMVDWSNSAFKWSLCLEQLGFRVVAYKGIPHRYNYPKQVAIHTALAKAQPSCMSPIICDVPEMASYVNGADIIWFHAETFINTGIDIQDKKIVVCNTGQTYMNEPEKCNAVFNPIANATIAQFPSLMGLGAKNEHLIYFPVDTDFIQPSYIARDIKPIIGHFPSTPGNKGTGDIIDVINSLGKKFRSKFKYGGTPDNNMHSVDWLGNLARMAHCDIIIEGLQLELNGKCYGEWGNTAFEAAALGKIVITNSLSARNNLYQREYGTNPELIIANTKADLEDELIKLLEFTPQQLQAKKEAVRDWVVQYHSLDATVSRLYDKVFKHFV